MVSIGYVGRLVYLSHTRPDIAYAVSVVSQFMHSPSEAHMDAVILILRYLNMAPGRGLVFSKNGHLNVEGYTDADWAGFITDRRLLRKNMARSVFMRSWNVCRVSCTSQPLAA